MYEYSHGGNAIFEDGKDKIIDLSANINPLGMPPIVRNAIIREIAASEHYPDNFSLKLREKIASFENVELDWIFCGGGSSDIIFRLPRATNAKNVAITAPTFSDYERSALSFGSKIIIHTLSASNGFAIDNGFIEVIIREKPKLIYICNPNNPTGRLTNPGFIERILVCGRRIGATVVVDECFLDFSDQAADYTSKDFLGKFNNLVILKAITKMFALPGIRLGYAICSDTELISKLYFHGADWSVSNLAQAAGIAALMDAEGFIRKTVEYITPERVVLERELTRQGFQIFPSSANFIFLQNSYALDLCGELDQLGMRIRSCENFRGLDYTYCRIAVSHKLNNNRLLSAVQALTGIT